MFQIHAARSIDCLWLPDEQRNYRLAIEVARMTGSVLRRMGASGTMPIPQRPPRAVKPRAVWPWTGWCRSDLWWPLLVPSRRYTVNPVRPGREQRQQRTRVPGCGWQRLPPFMSSAVSPG